ncbi:hypothetical protein QTP88_024725 [Uroleucon formosanum]
MSECRKIRRSRVRTSGRTRRQLLHGGDCLSLNLCQQRGYCVRVYLPVVRDPSVERSTTFNSA